MKWYANKSIARHAVEFMLVDDRSGRHHFGLPVQILMVEEKETGLIREPTMALEYDSAQSLLQALWDEGFRPNNGEGGPAEAVALRKHIAFAERVAIALLPAEQVNDAQS